MGNRFWEAPNVSGPQPRATDVRERERGMAEKPREKKGVDFLAKFFFYTSIKVTKLNNFSCFVLFFQSTYVYVCMFVCLYLYGATRQRHAAPPSKVPHMNESRWSEQVGGLDREPIVKRWLGCGDTKQKPVINGKQQRPPSFFFISQKKINDVAGLEQHCSSSKHWNRTTTTENISFCHGWHFLYFFFMIWTILEENKKEISTHSVGSEKQKNKATPKPRGAIRKRKKEISLGSFPTFPWNTLWFMETGENARCNSTPALNVL